MAIVTLIDEMDGKAKLQVEVGGQVVSSFTYYDGVSRVAASALTDPVVLSRAEYEKSIKRVEQWVADIERVLNPVDGALATLAQYRRFDSSILAQGKMNGYRFDVSYDRATSEVTVHPRGSTTMTWFGFLFFLKVHCQFVREIASLY